jgi:hypothetical protein
MLIIFTNNGEPLSWRILHAVQKNCQMEMTMLDNVGVRCHVTMNSDKGPSHQVFLTIRQKPCLIGLYQNMF